MQALVIGGGVSGLTTALALLEAGWEVTVIARAWAPDIVSSVAAAIWEPYQVAHPRALHWALVSEARFRTLMGDPARGVRLVEGWQLHEGQGKPKEWAGQIMGGFQPLPPELLPPGYASGYRYEAPLIETPLYMQWLRDEAIRCGARLETGQIATLDEVIGQWPLIVNCTGLAAREFVGDESMFPIRGQIVKVAAGLVERFVFNDEVGQEPIYLIPRLDGTIVGGTAQRGDWEQQVRPEETRIILSRAARLVPAVAQAPILAELVGLRPGRPTIRLEAEQQGNTLVVHNYGHGGAGFTLSWGCAEEVVALASQR